MLLKSEITFIKVVGKQIKKYHKVINRIQHKYKIKKKLTLNNCCW